MFKKIALIIGLTLVCGQSGIFTTEKVLANPESQAEAKKEMIQSIESMKSLIKYPVRFTIWEEITGKNLEVIGAYAAEYGMNQCLTNYIALSRFINATSLAYEFTPESKNKESIDMIQERLVEVEKSCQ